MKLKGRLGRRHISDQQSFPFESKKRPKLWNGAWSLEERYTQLDARGLVEYARLRGVRVIVEFVSARGIARLRCPKQAAAGHSLHLRLSCLPLFNLKSDSTAHSC